MKHIFLLFLFISLSSFAFSQPISSPWSPENTKAFADDLCINGFLEEAAGEYRRYLFQTEKTDPEAVNALTDIYRSRSDDRGFDWIKKTVIPRFEKEKVSADYFNFFYAGNLFIRRDSLLLKEHAASTVFKKDTENLKMIIVNASYYILEKDFEQTKKILSSNPSPVLGNLKKNINSYSEKSPVIALSLSAVIPGSGKWYGGSFWSGFSSLLSFSSLAAGTYWCYNQYGYDNWRTWVLGALTLTDYITDLYGSYQNALRVNEAAYRLICSETETLYSQWYE